LKACLCHHNADPPSSQRDTSPPDADCVPLGTHHAAYSRLGSSWLARPPSPLVADRVAHGIRARLCLEVIQKLGLLVPDPGAPCVQAVRVTGNNIPETASILDHGCKASRVIVVVLGIPPTNDQHRIKRLNIMVSAHKVRLDLKRGPRVVVDMAAWNGVVGDIRLEPRLGQYAINPLGPHACSFASISLCTLRCSGVADEGDSVRMLCWPLETPDKLQHQGRDNISSNYFGFWMDRVVPVWIVFPIPRGKGDVEQDGSETAEACPEVLKLPGYQGNFVLGLAEKHGNIRLVGLRQKSPHNLLCLLLVIHPNVDLHLQEGQECQNSLAHLPLRPH